MYKAAEEEINKGLSPTARYILALFATLFGILMVTSADLGNGKAFYAYLFGAFCFLISIACVAKGTARKVVGSIIGLAIFVISLLYMYSQISTGPFDSGSRSEPSILNSVFFFVAFGIPGITYAYRAMRDIFYGEKP